ncbi:putative transmembrane protein [Anopheles sinensis]|uniref:Putative transmembrane protein n=1 Tax=Anopheles sinensis TaxID=74873 RepID=A0A084VDY5_ANOSI|nr:putative transmembrane protein [Anopheles sinensis]
METNVPKHLQTFLLLKRFVPKPFDFFALTYFFLNKGVSRSQRTALALNVFAGQLHSLQFKRQFPFTISVLALIGSRWRSVLCGLNFSSTFVHIHQANDSVARP